MKLIKFALIVLLVFLSITIGGINKEMNIKTKIENFILNQTFGKALNNREKVFGNDDQEMQKYVELLIDAINERDENKFNQLFANNAIEEIGKETFKEMINDFYAYFTDGYVSCSTQLIIETRGRIDKGKKSAELKGTLDLLSSESEYYMAIKIIPYDDFDENNIGIWSVNVILKTDYTVTEHIYYGNGKFDTGIYIDEKEPLGGQFVRK